MKNLNLINFKNEYQEAIIDGVTYTFNFDENELAESIEKYNNSLSYRSGLLIDDYTAKDMAIEIASYWEAEDVENMINDLPVEELKDYIKELSHAA